MNKFAILVSLLSLWLGTAAGVQAQTYSPEAIDNLRYMVEEEKLAGNVYRAFAVLYPSIMPFKNIPRSEDTHFTALVSQAGLAGIDVSDLTSLAAGQFQNTTLQALYGNLIAQGNTSSFAALTVGKNIELLDIEDLLKAQALVPTTSSLYGVYGNLLNGSNNHLKAFNTWLAMTPAPAVPAVPEPATYAMLIAGLALVSGIARQRGASAKSA